MCDVVNLLDTTQGRCFAYFDVEFTEGDEPGIPDDEVNSSISEWLVTAFQSFVVIKSPPQGIEIRGEKLRHTLLDDDHLPLDTHIFGVKFFCQGYP